ncbi:MAG: glycosyltransferase family 2 protein [Bacteroidia bacterium]|nr:glycosyltransferase family 2 protein [Bacteroidia bacterium]
MVDVSPPPATTAVILNWNGKNWLEQFLPSVLASTYSTLQVLVVDNGSTDDSVNWIRATFPAVEVLALDQNYGFAEGNNKAIPHIHTPYFVLLNSDVEVAPGWLEPLVSAMEADPQLVASQPKLLAWHDKDSFEYAGAAGGWIDRFGYAFCRGRIFDELEQDTGQYDKAQDCLWATGACIMLRTEVVKQIGLFHGELFAHWEEIDFCWRAWNLGYRVRAIPQSVAYHVGGGTLPQGNPRKTFLNVRNSLICLYLNLPLSRRLWVMSVRLILDGVWGLKSLSKGDVGSVKAIIRAHWSFFGAIPFWKNKRKAIYGEQQPASMPAGGYWPHSVVWAHFAKGKKTFSEIVFFEKSEGQVSEVRQERF